MNLLKEYFAATFLSMLYMFSALSCVAPTEDVKVAAAVVEKSASDVIPAAERIDLYLPQLQGKKVGLVHNVPLIILDRPNPNAHYIDGPIMQEEFMSFVGMHPVPIVYGMTIGEYGQMINGELWLHEGMQCDLTVIPCKNYDHSTYYNLPIKPSPNLPNIQSIFLYPSLCLFEGTHVSVGRGTDMQFQMYGHPDWKDAPSKITIKSMAGAKYPKHENKSIGYKSLQSLTKGTLHKRNKLDLSYLVEMYQILSSQGVPFILENNNFFEKLAGTNQLRDQLKAGASAAEIRESWKSGIEEFKVTREKYLIY